MLNILESVRGKFFPSFTPTLQRSLPKTTSLVRGFTVSIERKNGCVLRSRPKDSPKDTPYTDSGVDEHFEVTVDYDGSNVLYPKAKQGQRKAALLTNSLHENGHGMVGRVFYYPPGVKFTRVEIEEKYEDWRDADIIGHGRPKPEHVVWLSIYTKHDGSELPVKTSIASRPAKE